MPVATRKDSIMRTTACFFSLLLAVPAFTQVRENVTVELIEVPVYVTTTGGQPIRGLTKENFDLRVNGKAQPIEYFDAIDFASPREKSDAPRPARERRLYLLMFDRVYSYPGLLERAQIAAVDAVQRSNPETDLFAVATYTSNKGVQFVTPFLSDRVAVVRAIGTLNAGHLRDPLGLAITTAERGEWSLKLDSEDDSGFVAGSRGDMADREMASAIRGGAAAQEMSAQPAMNTVQDLLGNFEDLARRLAALEGQKHLVLFSRGFNTALLYGGTTAASMTSGGGIDARGIGIKNGMVNAFRAAGVFLDTIDISGMRHTGAPINAAGPSAHAFTSGADESLSMLAHETGGEFVHNQNNLKQAIAWLTSSHEVVYVLAFNRQSNRSGTIAVHVKGVPHGTNVSYRQGFGNGTPAREVDPLQFADILIHDVPQSGLTLRLNATPTALTLSLPRQEIALQVNDGKPYVDTLLYVFDQKGAAILGGEKRIDVTQAEGPLVVRQALHLPPGHYVAKALARIVGTTSLGFARTEFTIE